MTTFVKPPRLAVLDTLPSEVRDNALLDWRTFATLIDKKDVKFRLHNFATTCMWVGRANNGPEALSGTAIPNCYHGL